MERLIRVSGENHRRWGGNRLGQRKFAAVSCALVLNAALAFPSRAQSPLTPEQAEKAHQLLDGKAQGGRLGCEIEPRKPFLDFTFRFTAGIIIRCPWKEFGGKESTALILARVTPEGGAPVLFSSMYHMRAMPPALLAGADVRKLKTEVEASGAFAVGAGRYLVEVLVQDNRNRICRKRWRIKAGGREHGKVPAVLEANTVAPFGVHLWEGKSAGAGKGLRLTVLLDAAPVDPRAPKLRAWDQEFLLDSLSSLLQQIPCQSVRLVAFNLEQQREIFRQDLFGPSDFDDLQQAFHDLELGTVSAQVLKQPQGKADLLARLTNQELIAEQPADAVIFLGPTSRADQKIPGEMLKPRETRAPQFFYFEYIPPWRRGREFPDTIAYLTRARDGTVAKIHSPGELAQAIQKMLKQVKPGPEEKAPGRPPSDKFAPKPAPKAPPDHAQEIKRQWPGFLTGGLEGRGFSPAVAAPPL
jgi:hypothetical protein